MNTLTEKAKHLKETVSLTDFLNRLGFQPYGKPSKETMYISMLRDSDTNASFSVNEKLGCWYDHGLGKGGNIIDFAQAFWKITSFKGAIEQIEGIYGLNLGKVNYPLNPRPRIKQSVKLPNYQIKEVKPFGTSEGINAYLKSRGVFEAAQGKMQEVHYYVEDEKKNRKNYFAAAWKNEADGWEVRNKYFKGCLGKKAMTSIHHQVTRHLLKFSWLIMESDKQFITTDNPGVSYDDQQVVQNIKFQGNYFFMMPLTPSLCIGISPTVIDTIYDPTKGKKS